MKSYEKHYQRLTPLIIVKQIETKMSFETKSRNCLDYDNRDYEITQEH